MSQLKKLVNDKPLWDSFCEMLEVELEDTHRKLEQSKDLHEMYRAQGAAAMLHRLQKLRDRVNG